MNEKLLTSFERIVDKSTTPVGVYVSKEHVLHLADTLGLGKEILVHIWDNIADVRCGNFFLAHDASRLVSYPERHTTEAKDGSLRPSIFTSTTYDFDVFAWTAFMATVLPDVRGKLEKLTSRKYDAFLPKWDHITIEMQMVNLMAYEAVACGLFREAAYEADMDEQELAEAFASVVKTDRDERICDLLVRYSPFRDVFFLTEVSGRLFGKLFKALGDQYEFVVPPVFDSNEKQHSIILVSIDKFRIKDTKNDDVPAVSSPHSWTRCLVEDKMTGEETMLISAHASSSSSEAIEYAKYCIRMGPKVVCGIDSNVVYYQTKPGELTYARFWVGLQSEGFDFPSSSGVTVFRRRTTLVVQKHAKITDAPLEKPCDMFLLRGVTSKQTRIDNTGIGEFEYKTFPNDVWPSDHAAVHMEWM